MNHVHFIFLRATPAWLRLTREQRRQMADTHLAPLLADPAALRMRYFDAEASTAVCSDVMLTETGDPRHHYHFMEGLRDSVLVTEPYFEVVQIVPAIEEGYREYERTLEARQRG